MHRSVVVGFVVLVLATTVCPSGVVVATPGAEESTASHVSPVPVTAGSNTPLTTVGSAGIDPSLATNSNPNLVVERPAQPLVDGTAFNFDAQSSQDFDSTRFEITVSEDGTATWTFRHERHLEGQEERENFQAFAEEFEAEETDLYVRYTQMAQAMIDTGSDHTGREMAAEDFNRSTDIEYRPNARGVVEISFTWTNFAPVEDDGTVVVGDVFDGGLIIMQSQTLVISPDGDLVFASVHPEGEYSGPSPEESSSVSWSGEREFLDGQPRVVLEPEAIANETQTPSDDDNDDANWVLVGGLLVFGLGAVAAIAWYRFGGGAGGINTGSGSGTGSGSSSEGPDPARPTGGAAAGTAASGAQSNTPAAGSSDADSESGPAPISDEELMTDEDRVVALIRRNGGRMKQVNIVEETGWSKSKVSMLLSDMEEEGTISKLRVGRENIVSLEGFEPEATKSPFEE
ncbi:helix-turn-helix transcriptional regulator [Halomontanus rarus]|uniref:helix-turn-helix transcriptional regulator n=1 Tax=Halomontanus rarus TaxID=3034020 RepID=UPI001F625AA3